MSQQALHAPSYVAHSRKWFHQKLAELGLSSSDLVVVRRRALRGSDIGYYSTMSQFRARLRVIVDDVSICEQHTSPEAIEQEIRLAIARAYGHAMVEAIRVVNESEPAGERFTVPDWKAEFASIETAFAEDFAWFCVTSESRHSAFWGRFLPNYAADFRRVPWGRLRATVH